MQKGPLAFDILVVGSGIAGLITALRTSKHWRVALVTKTTLGDGCSRLAQGGVAAAFGLDDSPELHFQDTVAAGRGLCNLAAVNVLVNEAPQRISQLAKWGVNFDAVNGIFNLGREAAHSRNRIVHAHGDATGAEIQRVLLQRLSQTDVQCFCNAHLQQILTDESGNCIGASVLLGDRVQIVESRATVLASGGASALWERSTNPDTATGVGIALAYDAGAEISGVEFEQFHPTVLAVTAAPPFLISEAVRGEGATVIDDHGKRFLFDGDDRGELAPRDLVAQSIWRKLQESRTAQVYLDCTPLRDRVAQRFPTIFDTCARYGIDISQQPIPISPAAHYSVGGVRVDLHGTTSIAGLFACGEVANTGVHGANRLASNSLLEAVVFGHRTADAAGEFCAQTNSAVKADLSTPKDNADGSKVAEAESLKISQAMQRLRKTMWENVGIVRNAVGLRQAAEVINEIRDFCADKKTFTDTALLQMATTAQLTCAAALARNESLGCHVRSDHPCDNSEWDGIWVMQKQKGAYLDHYT